MTVDDQLAALAPLDSGSVARLAGYAVGPTQLREYRYKGKRMPPKRLLLLAERLRGLAEVAERLAGDG